MDGSVAVDRVLRYEDLPAERASIWRALGIPGEPDLPTAKGDFRPARSRDFRAHFSDADAELIAGVCRAEISAQGYTFD